MAMATPTHSLAICASSGSISSSSRACAKADSANTDNFPAGLRVLVVDDDPICLLILDRMLRRCQYQVTTCGRATEALAMLRENRNSFDVIISDVYMPDMDGFKLLELVGLEMDLPVIMMSANGETSAVMKGIKHGACDYLLKPVRMEELRNIWQHVLRKKWRSSGLTNSHEDDKAGQAADEGDYNSSANEGLDGTWKQSKKRKDMKEEEEDGDLDNDDSSTTKKPRVVWSVDLHQQFVSAVNQLGIDKAVPKRILELMNVHGLTRENVASHLQKYRLYLKRISGVVHQSGGLNPSFPVSADSNFGPVSAAGLAGLGELRALTAGPSQLSLSPQASVSTLQAGMFGRLGTANNLGIGNMEPSLLLRIAALQGASNGALARPPSLLSYAQPLLNNQGAFQAGLPDGNQLQVSQLGAFAGSLDKGPPGLSALQQQQLAIVASLGGMGQLAGVNSNLQQVNPHPNSLLMQALQQQQVGGHLTSKGGSIMPTSGIVGQQGLSTDTGAWAAPISNVNATASIGTGQNSGSLRPVSVPSLVGACSASNILAPLGRTTDAESKGLHIPNAGNAVVLNSITGSSPLPSSGLDELNAARIKDMGSSLPHPNEGLPHSYGSKFTLFSGLKQGQGLHMGQRVQGAWQGFGLSQEYGQISDSPIRSPSYSQASSANQNLNLGVGQDQGQLRAPGFSTGLSSNFSLDNGRAKAPQSEHLRAESSLKVKEEGHGWLPEPLSDELLSIVLKQQQEPLGLTESEPGGADGYSMDNCM